MLGYRMASDMTRRLDEDDRGTRSVRTPSGQQSMTVISEAGLYAAILGSQVEGAREFKRWVTHDELPADPPYR
nr:Bro-N domain-containing protein [Salinispora arenicola]